jgi:putative ABC transport system permease protein
MYYLALRMARHRIAALLAVACAALGGAALVTGIGVLAESGFRSHAPVDRLAGADVVVSASQTYPVPGDLAVALPERAKVPGDLLDRLGRLPGVTDAIGDVSFPAAVVDPGGTVVPVKDPRTAGHGWSSTRLLDHPRISGRAPAGPHEVAMDSGIAAVAGVAPGDPVSVVAAGTRSTFQVSAVVTADGPGGIYFAEATAMRLAGRDRGPAAGSVDLLALRTTPGSAASVVRQTRDLVRDSGLIVSTGDDRGDVETPDGVAARRALPAIAGSLAGVSLLLVGFLVAGALAVSLATGRRDLALLRAVGATPRQVRRLAAAQATTVAAAAAVPGIVLGYLSAEQFRQFLVWAGMLPRSLPLTVSPLPAVGAALLLIAVALLATWCVAWRTSRMPATEAVVESRTEPRRPSRTRAFAGLLVLAAANVVAVTPLLARSRTGAAATALAGILATIGLGLAGPALVSRIGRALRRRLPAGVSAPTWLAVANSQAYALRAAGAVATLAMVVVFTLTYALTQTTVLAAAASDVHSGTTADVRLEAPSLGGVPGDVATAAAATPGVRAAAPVTSTTVLWPYRMFGDQEVDDVPALVLTPAAPGVLDLDLRAGNLADLTGDTVALDAHTARSRHTAVDDEIELILGDGARVRARVVALYARGFGFGPVVLSRDLAAGHTSTGLDQSVLVRTDGTDAARRALVALTASRPGLVIGDADGLLGTDSIPPDVWINIVVLGVLLGYLLLGIANRLVATTSQRRTELAALRLIGATPGQIRAMMRREAGLVCAVAIGTGIALSAIPLLLLSLGLLHRPWPAGPVWLLPAVAGGVACLAFLTVELPTRKALRTAPAYAVAGD